MIHKLIFFFHIIISLLIIVVIAELNLSEYPCFKAKISNHRAARIVGGYNSRKEDTPYIAAVTRSGGNVFCGSSIISDKYLIIAAHCLCNNQNKVMQTTQMKIYVGVHNITEVKNEINESGSVQEVFVSKIIMHPSFICGKKSDADIGEYKI